MHVGVLGGTSEFSENDVRFSDGVLGDAFLFQNDLSKRIEEQV
jgi:hypothetical protein